MTIGISAESVEDAIAAEKGGADYLGVSPIFATPTKTDTAPPQKIVAIKEALYDVYQFDPMILINMFHLQSSETLQNLSSPLLEDITELSRNSLNLLAEIFEDGSGRKDFIDKNPASVADIVWSLFTGVVLWEESKRMIDGDKNFLKETLDVAFDIFARGVAK